MGNKLKLAVAALLLLALLAVFAFSLQKVIAQLSEEKQAKDSFDALAASVRAVEEFVYHTEQTENAVISVPDTQTDAAEPTDAEPVRTVLLQYAELYAQNSDLFGWLTIEGTPIDYPVMYTPDDPEYYLHRDFYGSDQTSGVLFVDAACPPDGNFYLIYGHSMKNKTMFGSLPQYAKKAFWEEHKTVLFDTLYEKRTYTVMAAFYCKLDDTAAPFKYYEYRDLTDSTVFDAYLTGVDSVKLYDTGVTAAFGDDLITLSTCDNHTRNGRFVVVAKRIS